MANVEVSESLSGAEDLSKELVLNDPERGELQVVSNMNGLANEKKMKDQILLVFSIQFNNQNIFVKDFVNASEDLLEDFDTHNQVPVENEPNEVKVFLNLNLFDRT